MPKEIPTTQSQPVHLQPPNLSLARLTKLRQLAATSHDVIQDAVFAANPYFNFSDAEYGGTSVFHLLQEYSGRLSDVQFQSWAIPLAIKYATFSLIWRESEKRVFKGIWSHLKKFADLGCDQDTAREIYGQTALWAIENLADLLKPNQPAKPSTRLYDRAYWLARAETTRRLRHRERFAVDMDEAARVGTDQWGNIFVEPAHYPDLWAAAA
jgi:hypothetical protein